MIFISFRIIPSFYLRYKKNSFTYMSTDEHELPKGRGNLRWDCECLFGIPPWPPETYMNYLDQGK